MARSRGVLTIVQYEKHPITGEDLINEDVIIGGLNGLKGVKKSCWIYHDSDTYKQSDIDKTKERLRKEYIEKQNDFKNEEGMITISADDYVEREMENTYSYIVIGELKPPHYHIVILPKNDLDIQTIADIFGVPDNFVEINKNRKNGTTWYECVKYLTHKTTNAVREKKYIYPSEQVICNGFSYDEEMAEYDRLMETYGKALTYEEEIFLQVLHGEKTPLDVKEEDELFYVKYTKKLTEIHNEYLKSIEQPYFRLNIYIEGNGGEGKSLFAKALARALSTDKSYFKTGGDNVTFEGYKGEEVILWDDARASEVLKALKGEGNTMRVLNPYPDADESETQHIKFGSINLVNRVNIFNAVESYTDFIKGLVGGSFKEGVLVQGYRRFPVILRIHPEDFDILINMGFLNDTREFKQYVEYNHIRGNFAYIANVCKGNIPLRNEIISRTMEPVLDQINALEEKVSKQKMDEDEIREITKDFGLFDTAAIERDYRSHLLEEEKLIEKENLDKVEQAKKEEYKLWLQQQNEKFKQTQRDKENQQIGKEALLSLPLEELLKLKDEFDSEKRLEDLFSIS